MSIILNTRAYSLDTSLSKDQVQYTGPANTFSVKDLLTLSRTAPKPTTDFSGVARARMKMTKTVSLTGAKTTTGDAIVEVSISLPVGMAEADADLIMDDIGDLLISSAGQDVAWKHDINQ